MSRSIHGHEIIRLVAAADPPFTRDRLEAVAAERYGHDARFHACFGSDLPIGTLVTLLIARGKIAETDGVLRGEVDHACSHG